MTESQNLFRAGDSLSSDLETGPPPAHFFQVGIGRTEFSGEEQEARAVFQRFSALHIKEILDPTLLKTALNLCVTGQFVPGSRTAPGFREVEEPQRAGRVLNLALDRAPLLRWLERITDCGPLQSIEGRVTQTLCRPGDELYWHDDYLETEGRKLGVVINLSTETFEGGDFALRPKGGKTIFEHRYTQPGSALIFKVDRSMEHRVRPLISGGPRRVFAGWAIKAKGA